MDRVKLYKLVDEWVDADLEHRSAFMIVSEIVNGRPRLSLSIGGRQNLLTASFIKAMLQQPGIVPVLHSIIKEYFEYVSQESTTQQTAKTKRNEYN